MFRAITIAFCLMLGVGVGANPASAQNQPEALSGIWSGKWITHPEIGPNEAAVVHFAREIELESVPDSFVVRVTADNRYRLFVNGTSVSVGPARSDVAHWRFERVDLAPYLRAGPNRITATVWNWGDQSPFAQMSFRTGFLLEGEGDTALDTALATGEQWQVQHDRAYSFTMPQHSMVGGYYVAAPGENFAASAHDFSWNTAGSQGEWLAASVIQTRAAGSGAMRGAVPYGTSEEWQLVPSALAAMEETPERFAAIRRTEGVDIEQGVLRGERDLVIPANTTASILLDRGQLTNAYPVLLASGGDGATMRLTYAESLYDAEGNKGDRNEVDGKTIKGVIDTIAFDGGDQRRFQPLWWRTYRYVQLDVETGDDALALHDIHGIFTAYPMQQQAAFSSDQEWIAPIWDISWHGLRLSAYDTYMDTPYWEQLQYVGDTRVQALITLYNAGDDDLMRNAITLIDYSRMPDGLTGSRYPSLKTQIIPPFSLWWSSMVHDYWMHSDDPEFVASFVPGIRGVMGWYEDKIDDNGLLGPMPWWNFLDWAPEYPRGTAPGARDGNSVTISLHYAYTLRQAAELEDRFGEPGLAARYRALADSLNAAAREHAWDEARGLFADTPEMTSFSQHANVMAVLSGAVPEGEQAALMERVLAEEGLIQATVYFRFYVDEAMVQAGIADRYLERLDLWREFVRIGLTTTPEEPEPTRSDSHAWGAHPNYHLLASVLGVRPASEGFGAVQIAPVLGPMQHASGTIPHPSGPITIDLRRMGDAGIAASITLPEELPGTFVWNGTEVPLNGGTQELTLP